MLSFIITACMLGTAFYNLSADEKASEAEQNIRNLLKIPWLSTHYIKPQITPAEQNRQGEKDQMPDPWFITMQDIGCAPEPEKTESGTTADTVQETDKAGKNKQKTLKNSSSRLRTGSRKNSSLSGKSR